MRDNSGNGAAVVAIGLILILLLPLGGAGTYLIVGRQQAMAMQAVRVRAVAAEATARAEQGVAEAGVVGLVLTDEVETESTVGEGAASPAAVESVLRAQEEAWNRGDVEAFMEHYWKSDDLTFRSGGKTTRGGEATLKRYRERYPTKEKMGHVTFSGLEITPLGDSAAMVLGDWKLERETEPIGGNFTLILRKFDDRWLIIHDHTSQLQE